MKKIYFNFEFFILLFFSFQVFSAPPNLTEKELFDRAQINEGKFEEFFPGIEKIAYDIIGKSTPGIVHPKKEILFLYPGRSPHLFAEIMRLMGYKIIGIPLTDFRNNLNSSPNEPNLNLLKKYIADYLSHSYYFNLEEINQKASDIKRVVFLDIVLSGQSLYSFVQHAKKAIYEKLVKQIFFCKSLKADPFFTV